MTEKVRENRLRRMARRQLLRVQKSRIRDRSAAGFGGYMLVDHNNFVVLGAASYAYSASADDVERYLTDDRRPRFRRLPSERGQPRWHIPG